MSTPDESRTQNLYITSNIKRFQEVESLTDYTKIASRDRRSAIDDTDRGRQISISRWLHSWSRSDRLALTIAVATVVVLIVTILALLVAIGLL
jgi:hypothetical protein